MSDGVRLPRLAPLYAAGFVTAFGANSIAIAVSGRHEQLGLTLASLGVFLALYDFAELISKPAFGAFAALSAGVAVTAAVGLRYRARTSRSPSRS
ncbi:hypothetical protein [Microbacterium ginsengisoli]|uniref:Uncharacterized protein n=1 Tax=Microbacterium ginsengisoli TaxID=400772 RepID=A0A0F0LZZ1_9MICO|nr:hypothetical protein [Microbacterium ginsengisoli]KJL44753.1 hypothetical protein RR49_00118 [Microbacterium ginsengisoli]MCK9913389.1 hypothetical protein [Microbacteriaceae bacterium K1510]